MSVKQSTDTTHIAGPAVVIQGRIIQRCVLCGFKLIDSLNTAVPIGPDGTIVFPVFGERCMIRVSDNRMTDVGEYGDDPTPDDICLDLVE